MHQLLPKQRGLASLTGAKQSESPEGLDRSSEQLCKLWAAEVPLGVEPRPWINPAMSRSLRTGA